MPETHTDTFPENTHILMVDGGLGSQINKFILGQYIEALTGAKILYDLAWFESAGLCIKKKETRAFELLRVFPDLDFPVATPEQVAHAKQVNMLGNFFPFVFSEALGKQVPPTYINGYYAHWKYYYGYEPQRMQPRLEMNDLSEKHLVSIKGATCAVGVHVRRGDYIGSAFDVVDAEYYIHAIRHLQQELQEEAPTFFFFCTDLPWVEQHILSELGNEIQWQFIEGNDNDTGYYDFVLLNACNHYICANSSFSYNAAFLGMNPHKRVVIPEQWMANKLEFQNHHLAMRYPGYTVISNTGNIITVPAPVALSV